MAENLRQKISFERDLIKKLDGNIKTLKTDRAAAISRRDDLMWDVILKEQMLGMVPWRYQKSGSYKCSIYEDKNAIPQLIGKLYNTFGHLLRDGRIDLVYKPGTDKEMRLELSSFNNLDFGFLSFKSEKYAESFMYNICDVHASW